MIKEVRHLSVSTDEGKITIEQDQLEDEFSRVVITVDQVPLLIQWLQEAVAELEKPF